MPTWKKRKAVLHLDDRSAVLEAKSGSFRWTLGQWLTDSTAHRRSAEAIGLNETVSALGWAWEKTMPAALAAKFPERDADRASLAGRPRVRFSWSNPRGVPGAAWIMGRTVRVSLPGIPKTPDIPFASILSGGFPKEVLRAMPMGWADEIVQSVQRLAPLPCFCGTGFERNLEHDALAYGPQVQHPNAPVDFTVMATRCQVCGLRWLLEESGDSHYEYHYRVSPWVDPQTL
jgi:hypothetical protein